MKKLENRTALCLYGLIGQTSTWKDGKAYAEYEEIDPKIVFDSWNANLFDKNQKIDVFIHTWSVKHSQTLKRLYKPRKMIAENQINFNVWPLIYSHFWKSRAWKNPLRFLYNIWFSSPKWKQIFWKKRAFAAKSRWFSTHKSIELANKYSIENNINYETYISARLDLVLKKEINLEKLKKFPLNVAYFNTTPSKSMEADYSNKTLKESKFSDLIFIGKPSIITKLQAINENINKYSLNPHSSSYEALMTDLHKDDVNFFAYPWHDFSTVKTHFHNWKIGG